MKTRLRRRIRLQTTDKVEHRKGHYDAASCTLGFLPLCRHEGGTRQMSNIMPLLRTWPTRSNRSEWQIRLVPAKNTKKNGALQTVEGVVMKTVWFFQPAVTEFVSSIRKRIETRPFATVHQGIFRPSISVCRTEAFV